MDSLLGTSDAMRKVRAQVAAAAASGAHVLIYGPPGSGRGHVARAIHYQAAAESSPKLLTFDCRALNDDPLRRVLDGGLNRPTGPGNRPPTLLLENLEEMAMPHQERLLSILRQNVAPVRVIATLKVGPPCHGGHDSQ
jgi:transcriptional regulator with AAA-type ATPase domain